jgi:hypothetical protein
MFSSSILPPSSAASGPPSRLRWHLIAGLALLPVSVLLVQLQWELLNVAYWERHVIGPYLSPPDTGGLPLYTARPLMRWVLRACRAAAPAGLSVNHLNHLVQLLFIWLALNAMAAFAGRYLERGWAFAAALLLAATIPWGLLSLGYRISYPYDYPAIFFCTAGLYAIASRRGAALALIVFIGTLNKETTLYLIASFVGFELAAGGDRRRMLRTLALLCAAYAAAYAAPRFMVRADLSGFRRTLPFAAYDEKLARWSPRILANLKELAFMQYGRPFQNVYWPLAVLLPGLVFLRKLPATLRGLHLGLPVFVVPMFVFGNIWEVRLFNEILPLGIVSTLWLLAAADVIRRPPCEVPSQSVEKVSQGVPLD